MGTRLEDNDVPLLTWPRRRLVATSPTGGQAARRPSVAFGEGGFMKTRELFRVLRQHVEPPLQELGFEPFKDPSGLFLVWTRSRKGRKFETVACQADKWGWDPWRGSQFQVLLTRSRHRGNVALCREFAEMWDLLIADEKREVEVVLNQVIAKSRVPTEAEHNAHLGFNAFTEAEKRSYREACAPVELSRRPFDGLWLRFVDDRDVEAWAVWLSAWVPRVLARNAEADWSVFGWGG
jgi:hypothetical protein